MKQHFSTSAGSRMGHILQCSMELQRALIYVFYNLGIASYSFVVCEIVSRSLCTLVKRLFDMPFTKAPHRFIHDLCTL